MKYKYGKVTDCQVVPLHLGHTTFHNVISMDLKNFKYPQLSNKEPMPWIKTLNSLVVCTFSVSNKGKELKILGYDTFYFRGTLLKILEN